MFYLLTSLIIASILVCPAVDGATCVTKSTCEKTDFTLSTCISGTCSCLNTSYVPVRSGCALKMDKPVITSGQRRSNEVLSGERFTLTCIVDGAESFEWYLDDKLLNGFNEMSYNEEADASNVGSFTCRGIVSRGDLKSDKSDAFKVVLLGTGEKGTAVISTNIRKPLVGQRVILTCAGVNSGTVTYSWKKDSKPFPRQFDRKLQLDNIQKEESGYYSCFANKDNYYSYSSLYIDVSDSITKPIINVIGEFGTVNRLGENGNYWLVCYSESASDGMTYEWTVNGIKSSVTDKFYSLPSVSSSDNGDYVCKAKYKSLTSDDSNPKTLTVTAPGIPCYEDSFCLFPYGGYTGKCDETERCECSDGYSKRGNLCSEASLTVISSTVLIAVGLLYSRFVDL